MDRIAFLFPGQGSQTPGMGKDFSREYADSVRRYYTSADEILGLPLSRLCFEGSEEELRDTAVTQPGVFLTSLAVSAVLREHGVCPQVVAGHSLGEYSAMVSAGVLAWEDALRLVRRRGELMAGISRRTPGRMAAVLGLPAERVRDLCEESSRSTGESVVVANYNAPMQTVVSGTVAGVNAITVAARAAGATHVAELKVSAPFHSPLMKEIEAEFAVYLDAVPFSSPSLPVIANATATYVQSGDDARQLLMNQLSSPVHWSQTLELLVREDVDALVEVGPGRVLTNISRGSASQVPAMAVGTVRQLHQALARLTAARV
ncbi:ACP S-malonyltransferase [Streptomyces sp. MD20-1-1]|uniref:ACP S-malonyltransferase n=1 Tax=Streptomyces sp. MD20-1-1 TaxID=3028668 RepID=UPI0029AA46FC|nr:ACP S-malonyltransferase [Streptomyces sp. MD20-1-1]